MGPPGYYRNYHERLIKQNNNISSSGKKYYSWPGPAGQPTEQHVRVQFSLLQAHFQPKNERSLTHANLAFRKVFWRFCMRNACVSQGFLAIWHAIFAEINENQICALNFHFGGNPRKSKLCKEIQCFCYRNSWHCSLRLHASKNQ